MPTSNQIDDLTSSKNGRNVQAKLQAKSHFFVEGSTYTQTSAMAFGALSTDVFRTTAKVNLSTSKKVYAICRGQLFVQPQTGSTTKVNVILKPFTQPINGLGIKYFIYRGLAKSDFVASGEVAAETTTELTQYLWDQFNNFYDNGVDPVPAFAEQYIGLPIASGTTQSSTDLIDVYFNKITEVINTSTGEEEPNQMFELPIVPKGMHLSSVSGDIGIDVVLDFGEYYFENDQNPFQLNLEFARKADNTIDISSVTNSYQAKLYKEACTQFMDLAAFYGMHANEAGKLDIDDGSTTLTTAVDIYTKMSGFHTKNNLYIYIQANRQRSYNFYGNYEHSDSNSNTINIGGTEATMVETTFGTLGWPIHIFSETQNAATNVNTVCFQLTTDNYPEARLYANIGILISENEIGFVRGENLLQTPSSDPQIVIDTNYTHVIESETPSIGANTVSSILQIIYEGKIIMVEEYFTVAPTDPVFHVLKDIDDIFGLIDAKSFKRPNDSLALPTIVDERLQIINFENSKSKHDIGMIKHQRTEDKIEAEDGNNFLGRATYESLVSDINRSASSYSTNISASIDSAMVSLTVYEDGKNQFFEPKPPYFFQKKLFTDMEQTITGLLLGIDNKELITKKILGLSNSENQLLKDTILSFSLNNPKIYFEDKLENKVFESIEGLSYKKYNIVIVAEDISGNLLLFRPISEIQAFAIDQFVIATNEYAKYTPELNRSDSFTTNHIKPE
jgi:hypothetical protein